MIGSVNARPKNKRNDATGALSVPDDLARRLIDWVDVREVGAEGFWLWLGTVLPLLPVPSAGNDPPSLEGTPSAQRLRELGRDLVDCARDRARLTVMCDRYFRDNQVLARRLKALEAAVRTFERAGPTGALTTDPDAGEAAERYLPPR
ncbi:MAG: hypothetical protein WBF81_00655 [Thermoplasmata archaeon]